MIAVNEKPITIEEIKVEDLLVDPEGCLWKVIEINRKAVKIKGQFDLINTYLLNTPKDLKYFKQLFSIT